MIVALFDLDGTLYTGHIWQDLVRHHWTARRHRRWAVAYVARNMAPLPLYKAGLLSQATFFRAWGATISWLLRGWTVGEGQTLFARLAEERIMPNLRPDVLEQVVRHQAEGHLVALVSGTLAPLLDQVARRMGVKHAIGTPLEVRDGRYTGRIVPPLCQSEGKPQRVRAYLEARGKEIEWAASFAYADLNTDLPMLELVGHPVAVYPEESLWTHAQARGWAVIGEVGR